MRGFYIVAAVVIAVYIAYVVRAFKRGTLSFKGQPAPPRMATPTSGNGGGEIIGGCVLALLVLGAMLVGLFMVIWIIKRMWEAA